LGVLWICAPEGIWGFSAVSGIGFAPITIPERGSRLSLQQTQAS